MHVYSAGSRSKKHGHAVACMYPACRRSKGAYARERQSERERERERDSHKLRDTSTEREGEREGVRFSCSWLVTVDSRHGSPAVLRTEFHRSASESTAPSGSGSVQWASSAPCAAEFSSETDPYCL